MSTGEQTHSDCQLSALHSQSVRLLNAGLPREFNVVMNTAVYIPPDANANSTITHASFAVHVAENNSDFKLV